MKKLMTVTIIAVLCLCMGMTALANGEVVTLSLNAQSDVEISATPSSTAINFTCGVMQSGYFNTNMLTSQDYTVYLQGGKQVAFMTTGSAVATAQVYTPSGNLMGIIGNISGTVSKYGIFTTPSGENGRYLIRIQGAFGAYTVNCLTGHGVMGTSTTNSAYYRSSVVSYATQYALSPNPSFVTLTADGANYASQCIHNGYIPMVTGTGDGPDVWFGGSTAADCSYTWKTADGLMRHWTKVRLSSYNGRAYAAYIYSRDYVVANQATVGAMISTGDIVLQLNGEDSTAYQSLVVTQKTSSTTIKYSAHASDGNKKNADLFAEISEMADQDWIVVVKVNNG